MKLLHKVFVVLFMAEYFVFPCQCVLLQQPFKKAISFKKQISFKNLFGSSSKENSPTESPKSKDEELIMAAGVGDTDTVERLIDDGVNVNAQDKHGMSALHWAADNGHYEVAKILVYSRADVNLQDFFLNTPLHIASSRDDLNMMQLFMENGSRLSTKNLSKFTPLKLCTIKDQLNSVLSEINTKGLKLLDAIKKGNIKLAKKLIEEGVDMHSKYYENLEGKTPIYQAITSGQVMFASSLVIDGADLCETTSGGLTLRELAALKGMALVASVNDQKSKIKRGEKRVHEWLQENPSQKEIEKQQKLNGHALTWQAYHRFEDIHSFLQYLAKKYPKLCKIVNIGESHEGRPLVVLRISNGNPGNKAIWIDGGIHAREWISPAAITYVANDLVKDWSKQPTYMQNLNWYILPVHNPDGYEFSHQNGNRFWRKNRKPNGSSRCVGVDLNRNYGYRWGKTLSSTGMGENDPCNDLYCGASAFSESETEAVRSFFNGTDEQFCGFLTFHSFGKYIVFPNDRRISLTHVEASSRIGAEGITQMNEVGNQKYIMNMDPKPASGCSDDWARSIGIKYSYTVELRDMGRYGYLLPVNQIIPTAEEAQAFVRTISKAIFEDTHKELLELNTKNVKSIQNVEKSPVEKL